MFMLCRTHKIARHASYDTGNPGPNSASKRGWHSEESVTTRVATDALKPRPRFSDVRHEPATSSPDKSRNRTCPVLGLQLSRYRKSQVI